MAGKVKKKPARDLNDERGEYRPIYTVLIHGPDYQALSPMEKLVFIHLKLNLGPAGIGVLYSGVLAEQTGYSDEQIRLAIDILSARGWVAHERNVFWVVDGLKYEPSLSKKNDNHKAWIARFLRGLPKLNVVKHFCDRYREWLPSDWVWDGDGIPQPMSITTTTTTTTTDTTTNTKTKAIPDSGESAPKSKRPPPPKYPSFPDSASDPIYDQWIREVGSIDYGVLRKTLAPLWPQAGPIYAVADILEAVKVFKELRSGQPPDKWSFWTIHKFAREVPELVRLGKQPYQDPETHAPTERMRLSVA